MEETPAAGAVNIGYGKWRSIALLIISIYFVVFGGLRLVDAPVEESANWIILASRIFLVVWGIFGFIWAIKRLLRKTPVISVSDEGIYDNSTSFSAGFISWADVTEIKAAGGLMEKFLIFSLRNPEDYLNKLEGFKRRLAEANFKRYGTPVIIATNQLSRSYKDIRKLIEEKWQQADAAEDIS
ncbi:MAG: hypothetical protein JWO06_4097 [Bacteroidota bacterium]|nr:hypothetical protein [Bacteroidota bacterium]